MITISIPHDPIPWAAPRLSPRGVFDSLGKLKKTFRTIIASQYKGPIIEDPVCLRMIFTFPIPKSTSKKKRQDMLEGMIIPTRCDCTNLQKLYEDCLKGIVIKDDRQVAMVLSEKNYGEKANVEIFVKKLFTDGEC